VLEVIENLKEAVTTLAIEHFSRISKSRKIKICFSFEMKFTVFSRSCCMCDGCIEIPQLGTKHSLNISAGIVWDLFQKNKLSSFEKVILLVR
jgi:hypothetical protein